MSCDPASGVPLADAYRQQWISTPLPPLVPYLVAAVMVLLVGYSWPLSNPSIERLPTVNRKRLFSFNTEAKRVFAKSAKQLMARARTEFPGQPYRMMTDMGEIVMLPPEIADEIRNEPTLSFTTAIMEDFHGGTPGFETFGLNFDAQLLQIIARKQLTKLLSKVTQPLSEETARAVSINLGEDVEWCETAIGPAVLDIIARISSRVFLGEELCRDEAWLKITKEYTLNMFLAAAKLRIYPKPLRRFAHWFIPACSQLRAQLEESRRVIFPVIQRRQEARRLAGAAGSLPELNDALEWAEEEAGARELKYDPAIFQLMLSTVAIHTTSHLLMQAMLDIAAHPEIVQPLREEIAEALRKDGWKKTSLYNMKLLDSVLKESQRMTPSSIASMRRRVEGDVTLSNGLVLRQGMRIMVDSGRMTDPRVHRNPEAWDGRRFLEMRRSQQQQPGQKKEDLAALAAQLVATSPDHLGFGHGRHACPGRFFAANELKVALCHLLIKYDWETAPGSEFEPIMSGVMNSPCPTARLRLRRRERVEIDLDSI